MEEKPQPETVEQAVQTDRLSGLVALRNTLARSIDSCDSMRDLAALSRQLTDVLQQIDAAAPTKPKGDAVDEITARRAARGAGASAGQARASKSSS